MFGEARARRRAHTSARNAIRIGCVAMTAATLTAGSALAAGPGLPRTYDVSRHDSPVPAASGQYPLGLANAGDLNGDGKEDFITSQLANTRDDTGAISANGNGAIYIISGATNERIRTIESPDPGGPQAPSPAPLNNRANFAFPWVSKVGANRTSPALYTDIGSCANPTPNAGQLCRSATVGAPDGVPDILVGARGVDANDRIDSGRVYVFDGATFALLKRIDQPLSDTTPVALARQGGTWFGRTVLNPSGLPPCEGNAGVGSCETMPLAVARGDVDGGGVADLVIGASSTSENSTTAAPGSHCARTPGAVCLSAGRVYVYRGEDIVGSSPEEILDGTIGAGGTPETITTIRNPHAQADNQDPTNGDSEIFGNSLTPIGDVGTCRALPFPRPAPGGMCPRDNGTATPDGKPDYVISGQRNDLPLDNPDPALADAGAAYLVDGATGTILVVYRNPEAQLGATFGNSEIPFATGDLGDTGLPDVFIPSVAQNVPGFTAAGRGYVLNGNHKASVSGLLVARLDDPTPSTAGNFGPGATGVGDLVPGPATPANEVLVGAASSRNSRNDIHFFNAATERVLQTITDPDAQDGRSASQFGEQIIPLGDLNSDTFLDFGVTAPLYDSPANADEGRVYVFRSNNTPLPAVPPAAAPEGAAPAAPVIAPAPGAPALAAALNPGRCSNDLRGTTDGDSLVGTIAGDTIISLTGDDIIEALAGHDCVDAGGDRDDVAGGSGNDTLLGGAGDDKLDGGPGADRLFGQIGSDVLWGRSGSDMLAGGDGNDSLSGGSGADRLFGERGNDRLVAGGSGGSTLDGGTGNDRIDTLNGKRDSVRCGGGYDRAVVDRKDRVSNCERVTRKRT